jgi:DNA polymerase-3 subunit alpha
MIALRDGMGEWEGKGYEPMALAAGLSPEQAVEIWSMVVDFAKYSFNKSHAIAYACMAFRTIYAKWMGTPEFTMACIRTNPDDAGKYVGEGRRMGVKVNPPHILHSEPDIAVMGKDIYFGFSNIKGIGKGTGQTVVDLRENGWEERDEVEDDLSLDFRQTIAHGGPEALWEGLLSRQYWWEQERDHAKRLGLSFKKKSPRQHINENKLTLMWNAGCWDEYIGRDLRLSQRQKLEKELLGVILTDDCEEVFTRNTDAVDACDAYGVLDSYDEVTVRLPGVVSEIRPTVTKKDKKPMGIVTIEYQGEQCEFVVFSRPWADYKFLWKERTPAVFTLTKNDRGVRFERALKLS